MTPDQIMDLSPRDLALMLRGERWRRNMEAGRLAWLASIIITPHIGRADSWKAKPQRLIRSVPGYDPDPEDLQQLRKVETFEPPPEVSGTPPTLPTPGSERVEGYERLNALFDRIEQRQKETPSE